ncbi:MAG: Rieske (2Fe-2S) protein [Halobacteriaceae archaeon]
MSEPRIAAVEEVPDDSTFLFTVRDAETGDEREAVLVRTDGGVAAWFNYCRHWTDVRLDRGGGATVRAGELVCGKHGATFEPDTGHCDFGPCEGAYLEGLDVVVEDDVVYLAERGYEFVGPGPADERGDLSTSPGERLGF